MTRYTTAYESGFLARFTATVASAVPEFDPTTNPIGHALANEIFVPAAELRVPDETRVDLRSEPVAAAPVEPAVETELFTAVEPVEPVAQTELFTAVETSAVETSAVEVEGPADDVTENERFGDLVKLPVAVSPIEWFGATTEPDEELDEQVLRAG